MRVYRRCKTLLCVCRVFQHARSRRATRRQTCSATCTTLRPMLIADARCPSQTVVAERAATLANMPIMQRRRDMPTFVAAINATCPTCHHYDTRAITRHATILPQHKHRFMPYCRANISPPASPSFMPPTIIRHADKRAMPEYAHHARHHAIARTIVLMSITPMRARVTYHAIAPLSLLFHAPTTRRKTRRCRAHTIVAIVYHARRLARRSRH